MKPSAGLISRIIEFSSGMKRRIYHALCGNSGGVKIYRNASPIIRDGRRPILFKRHPDLAAVACKMLVHRIVHNLVDQMVQSFGGNASYIHSRPFPYRFQSFQYGNTVCIVCIFLSHSHISFPLYIPTYSRTWKSAPLGTLFHTANILARNIVLIKQYLFCKHMI